MKMMMVDDDWDDKDKEDGPTFSIMAGVLSVFPPLVFIDCSVCSPTKKLDTEAPIPSGHLE